MYEHREEEEEVKVIKSLWWRLIGANEPLMDLKLGQKIDVLNVLNVQSGMVNTV